jgi:hypothetical protein
VLDAIQNPADAPVFIGRVFPHVLQELGADPNYEQSRATLMAESSEDEEASLLGFTENNLTEGLRAAELYFASTHATPEQLQAIKGVLQVDKLPENTRDLGDLVVTKTRENPALLTPLQMVLSNTKY